MGGQLPNNLAIRLHRAGVRILGTSAESIDMAEDPPRTGRAAKLGLPGRFFGGVLKILPANPQWVSPPFVEPS
jgi:hypothetical protein